jgi:hypothetical protein
MFATGRSCAPGPLKLQLRLHYYGAQIGHTASQRNCITPHVTRHSSHITRHTSHITRGRLRWLGNTVYNVYSYFSPFSNLSCVPPTFPSNITALTAQLHACVSVSMSSDDGVEATVTSLQTCALQTFSREP